MSDNPRNTQFAGFADLVYEETGKALSHADMKLRIARLAYDLVAHTIRSQAQGMDLFVIHDPEWMQDRIKDVPDMKEPPKEK